MDRFGECILEYEKPDNLVEFFEQSVKKYPNNKLFGVRNNRGDYIWITYKEIYDRVLAIRSGLSQLGVKEGDRVAIISANRPEWFIGENAVHGLKAIWVPMYEKELLSMWHYIIKDAEVSLLFIADEKIYEKLGKESFFEEFPQIKKIVIIDSPTSPIEHSQDLTFSELEEMGKGKVIEPRIPSADDIAEIIYTSGTTGDPKGVLLTHGNLTSNTYAGLHNFYNLNEKSRTLVILPWAHSYGLTAELHAVIGLGASMGIMGSIDTLADDFVKVRPTFLVSVPRVFNKIYAGIFEKVKEESKLTQKLFYAAVKAGLRKVETGKGGIKYKILDTLVLKQIRKKFGGRLTQAMTASAKMDIEIAKFFMALGIHIYDCYGMTECSPGITMNSPKAWKLGTVGKPIEKTLVVIDKSRVEEGSKDGEIICFGPQVMKGYLNKPEKTKEVLVELEGIPGKGMRTGDRGWLDDEGFLHITGRFKEEYKLQNGKYVHPGDIEESLKLLPYVENAFVYGDGKPYNIALIYPDFKMLQHFAEELKLSIPVKDLLKNKKFMDLVKLEMQNHLRKKFGGYEIPRKFLFILEDFTVENKLLTQTMKLKRDKVLEKYREEIEKLYEEDESLPKVA